MAQSDLARLLDASPAKGIARTHIVDNAGLGSGAYTLADMHIATPGTVGLHYVAITDGRSTPTAEAISRQEFVDGFGPLGSLYEKAVGEKEKPNQTPSRTYAFQERMEKLAIKDPQTFRDIAHLGQQLGRMPPVTPERIGEIGKSGADILQQSLERWSQQGAVDPNSDEVKNLMGVLSGLMIAARGGFDPQRMSDQTALMVDGMEQELATQGLPFIHAIVWGDTGEPGMVISPQELSDEQRHKFMD